MLSKPRVILGSAIAISILALPASPASAQGSGGTCDAASAPALQFSGLPSRVIYGRTNVFHFESNAGSDAQVAGLRVRVQMRYADGRTFADVTGDWDTDEFYVVLDLGDRPVSITVTYPERQADGATCTRTLTRQVSAFRKFLFPGRCQGGNFKPRTVIVACGDGNLYLSGMRWRHWNSSRALGRGTAHANDCVPFCAHGHFHEYRANVVLSRPRECKDGSGYQYTRLRISYPGRYPGGSRSYSVPFNC